MEQFSCFVVDFCVFQGYMPVSTGLSLLLVAMLSLFMHYVTDRHANVSINLSLVRTHSTAHWHTVFLLAQINAHNYYYFFCLFRQLFIAFSQYDIILHARDRTTERPTQLPALFETIPAYLLLYTEAKQISQEHCGCWKRSQTHTNICS